MLKRCVLPGVVALALLPFPSQAQPEPAAEARNEIVLRSKSTLPAQLTLRIGADQSVDAFFDFGRGYEEPRLLKGTLVDGALYLKASNGDGPDIYRGQFETYRGELLQVDGHWEYSQSAYDAYRKSGLRRVRPTLFLATAHPMADSTITCDEMAEKPDLIFDRVPDLGSGFASELKVDYRCARNVGSLDFLKPLRQAAGALSTTTPNFVRNCMGSSRYAYARYREFEYLMHGYYPQRGRWVEELKTLDRPPAEIELGGMLSGRYAGVMEHFWEWRSQSLYNRDKADLVLEEFRRVEPAMTRWYREVVGVSETDAALYSAAARQTVALDGFLSVVSGWRPEPVVPGTKAAQNGQRAAFIAALERATNTERINSLRRLLIDNADDQLIDAILASITDATIAKRSETPLSVTVQNPERLRRLIVAGFDPNHQNAFGKTALYYAIQYGNHQAVKDLIAGGAAVNHSYQLEQPDPRHCTGIERWGRTPLMHAAQHAELPVVMTLLDHGADYARQDALGDRAIDYARSANRRGTVAFLEQLQMNLRDNEDNGPL